MIPKGMTNLSPLLFRPQGELAALESQGRIAKLSSDDLQAKLMQAFADNEELARKLREAEEALRDKVRVISCSSQPHPGSPGHSWLFIVRR